MARFQNAIELQDYIDSNGGSGLIVHVHGDEVAIGDENHSPTPGEYSPLSEMSEDEIDAEIERWIDAVK